MRSDPLPMPITTGVERGYRRVSPRDFSAIALIHRVIQLAREGRHRLSDGEFICPRSQRLLRRAPDRKEQRRRCGRR